MFNDTIKLLTVCILQIWNNFWCRLKLKMTSPLIFKCHVNSLIKVLTLYNIWNLRNTRVLNFNYNFWSSYLEWFVQTEPHWRSFCFWGDELNFIKVNSIFRQISRTISLDYIRLWQGFDIKKTHPFIKTHFPKIAQWDGIWIVWIRTLYQQKIKISVTKQPGLWKSSLLLNYFVKVSILNN